MIIEEKIVIAASAEKVWGTFTDITRWNDWNTVLKNVSPNKTEVLTAGGKVRLCIYPFNFPVYFEPAIDEVILGKKIVWSSGKYGISARHEFIFREVKKGMVVTSREAFSAIGLKAMKFLFPESRIRELTVSFLNDLKKAAESS